MNPLSQVSTIVLVALAFWILVLGVALGGWAVAKHFTGRFNALRRELEALGSTQFPPHITVDGVAISVLERTKRMMLDNLHGTAEPTDGVLPPKRRRGGGFYRRGGFYTRPPTAEDAAERDRELHKRGENLG